MLKFVHCADIHIDSPLRGLSQYPGAPVELLKTAPRDAFSNLVDHCIEEKVNFMIIAGDLYDGDWRDFNTGIYFSAQMGRLREVGIRVIVLYGNHDAESQITKTLTLPDNVHVFKSQKPHTIEFKDLGVAIHGQSFSKREVTENLALNYPEPLPNLLNIGVLHTALEGDSEHATYAPCSLDQLINKGYHYWALGHIHRAQTLHENPYIVFPGNLQGRHIREIGPKGAVTVSVSAENSFEIEPVYVDVVRWEDIKVDVSTATNDSEAFELVRNAIEKTAKEKADGRVLAARVTVFGKSPAHSALLRKEDQFKADVRSIAVGLGSQMAWVERVNLEIDPETSVEILAERKDALGDLQQMLITASKDTNLVATLKKDLGELLAKLPSEIRGELEEGALSDIKNENFDSLIKRISPYLILRLSSMEI